MIVAEVQLIQMEGIRVQSWGQRSTAFLCDQATRQPEIREYQNTCTNTDIVMDLTDQQTTVTWPESF